MSRRFNSGHQEMEGTFDLNITPIIDCLTVVVTFLLISASLVSMGVFAVGVTTTDPEIITQSPTPPKDPSLEFVVQENASVRVIIRTRTHTTEKLIPGLDGRVDRNAIGAFLKDRATETQGATESVVVGEGRAAYQDLVHTVEVAKQTVPAVFIGDPVRGK